MADEGLIVGATEGMYSNIPWMRMIDQLVAVERRRIRLWQNRRTEYQREQNAWRDLNMRLSNLKNNSDTLLKDATWRQVTVTTTDEKYVTATDPGAAVAGVYNFRVWQLATSSTLVSSDDINNKAAKRSSQEVISGTKRVDLKTTRNPWTQFENPIGGTITISNAVGATAVFTISNYTSVEGLINAVNADTTLNADGRGVRLRYDGETDRFIIEAIGSATVLGLNEAAGAPGTRGFFTETKIAISHPGHPWTVQGGTRPGDDVGIDPRAKLSDANFDSEIAPSGSFKVNGETIRWSRSWRLSSVMSAITTSKAGVNAFYDESLDKVILTSKEPGKYEIKITDDIGGLAAALKLTTATLSPGQGSKFTINSTNPADVIEKETNTFTIAGTTFTLKKTNVKMAGVSPTRAELEAASPTTITVAHNVEAVKASIKAWVDQWNSAMNFLREKLRYDQATGVVGELTGDGTATSIQQQMYTLVTSRYDAKPPNLPVDMNQLAHIGITLGAFRGGQEGRLVIDDKVLTKALTERLEDVKNLFGVAKDGGAIKDYGVAYAVHKYTDDLTKGTGIIANRIRLYTNPQRTGLIDRIDKEIRDFEKYLDEYRKRLRREFETMERAMGQMQHQLRMLTGYAPARR